MRKKVIKYALMTLLCISFTGCNGKRTLTEEEIRKEIQAKDVFYSQGLEIKEFEIIKRQTDTADREDVIYIHVEGENLDFSVVRNYKLTYLLYNDGWKLETIEPYSDVEYYDETIPLHGLTSEIVESYFEDLKNYNPDTYFSSQLLSVTYGEIEKLESDTYYEIYQQVNIYDYELFQEEIIITISFTLDNFEWVAQTDFSNRPYLKETAMGEWYSDVEVGYAMPDGIYEGGNGVTGYINVSLASESKSDVFCKIDAWMSYPRSWIKLGGCSVEDIVQIDYLYDNEKTISGILIIHPYNMEETVTITLDGLIYTENGIEWKLIKVS